MAFESDYNFRKPIDFTGVQDLVLFLEKRMPATRIVVKKSEVSQITSGETELSDVITNVEGVIFVAGRVPVEWELYYGPMGSVGGKYDSVKLSVPKELRTRSGEQDFEYVSADVNRLLDQYFK